ncbi:polynucleotide kinase-phosphatase [Actinophytocola xinjiangensis]|uniref:Polynucleotide kinase-phosphatase n=1 Tax=Actinophytocola xinjiangensis TaxID=485602 RepID=A0A7Z0WRH9_9PSEU|nr:polynucleotide kinase-phosphatase [Actinophytocola xinjiangensis]OLF12987.1 polynucleotide kinase-phosphatase [Actinophytocola xinjiangensis]
MPTLAIPELSLVALVGVSGSGKSTFAARHFAPTQVLSSDFFRGLVADDENDQSASADAFAALYQVAALRLRAGRLTVVDATHLHREDRARLVAAAREQDVLPVAVVFDLPPSVARERNAGHRALPDQVLRRQQDALRRSVRGLGREGFRKVHVLSSVDDVAAARVEWEKAYNDRRELTGPFDVIGDVHGCLIELRALLTRLGYVVSDDGAYHPGGRTAVFVGDLVDRGPATPGVLRLVMGMVEAGTALCVAGNHEAKLVQALDGRKVRIAHGRAESLAQLAAEPAEFRARAREFMYGLISHYRLDGGRLVVAHAGLKEQYQGRSSGRVRAFCLYGDTTGETDEYGLPVRLPWAQDYRGAAAVVYGHTTTTEAEWVNNTICLDTGCVFGGELTALRWPERELVSVPAEREYYAPVRPLAPLVPQRPPGLLRLDDVLGARTVETRLLGHLKVPEENAAGALEVMSRFAVDPRWLVYLPPTMAPPQTSTVDGMLEHPAEAFTSYRSAGVAKVVCEEKHMGSRAVAVVCRTPDAARTRFAVDDGTAGALYTRTGRPFFDEATTASLLDRVRRAAEPLWSDLDTDWLALDLELLPWSAKAGALLRDQYAPVGAAARTVLPQVNEVLAATAKRLGPGVVDDLAARQSRRLHNAQVYTRAYGRYCWPVDGLDGIALAPFAVLAGAGGAYAGQDRDWHHRVLDTLVAADPELFRPTRRLSVDVTDETSVAAGIDWWTELTATGGEGMVVKPFEGLARGKRGLVQPGVKCRGPEYLRIIYGPDYPDHLDRLRQRSLGRKRSLALREYALGLEALDRFVDGEPLWRVHEPVFAVLALESEAVDPRL